MVRKRSKFHLVINAVQKSVGAVEGLHHFFNALYAFIEHQVLPIVLERGQKVEKPSNHASPRCQILLAQCGPHRTKTTATTLSDRHGDLRVASALGISKAAAGGC